MDESSERKDLTGCRFLLKQRLSESAPGPIQLLAGPRQVGKTTLLLELAEALGESAVYAAADSPEASLPGFWDRLWADLEARAKKHGQAQLFLDEAHLLPRWSERLKGEWDRLRRMRLPVHVVATGSSALRLTAGTRESLAGRFERHEVSHWSATDLARAFRFRPEVAARTLVSEGGYPGAFAFRRTPPRWLTYVRDAIVDPAIGRDLLAMTQVRKPGLLRQVYAVCAASPAQVVSLQKIQGQLQDAGALETVAHYLALLQEAFLVAPLSKFTPGRPRGRAAPPKLVILNNALLAAAAGQMGADVLKDPARLGPWVENACLAHAINQGQQVTYWREEPLEVDGVLSGSWGKWAIEVKLGRVDSTNLRGLLEFTRRHPAYRPLVLHSGDVARAVGRLGVPHQRWEDFLLQGPPSS